MQPDKKHIECLIYRNVSLRNISINQGINHNPLVSCHLFWYICDWQAEVKTLMKCSACLFCSSISHFPFHSLSLCVLQKLSLGILHRYFENSFLELAYVDRKLECLWRSPLTALMPWGSEALVSRCQRGPSPPAEGARTNWATFGNLSKLISSWARVMISSVSSSL